jgi:fumarate hydratase subunit alpha
MTALKMFTPAATSEDIIRFVVDSCVQAGSNPCPPIVVGVGLGGTSDKAAFLAKKALTRPLDAQNSDPRYAEMEQKILAQINASGVGPQGLGGTVTALAVAIEPFATHIAGLPCVVNIGCHVTRHAEGVL